MGSDRVAIRDARFLEWIEANLVPWCPGSRRARHVIETSCRCKSNVVSEGREQDTPGDTQPGAYFGHANRARRNYKDRPHGEAVAVGMLMAADLSLPIGMGVC